MCRENLLDHVVHTETTKVAFETLKSRMISALDLLFPQAEHNAEFVVANDANKVGIVWVLLQEETS